MCRDTITVSLLEVYNEEIRDLLVVGGSHEKLEVRQSDGGNHVPGLTVMTVSDLQVPLSSLIDVVIIVASLIFMGKCLPVLYSIVLSSSSCPSVRCIYYFHLHLFYISLLQPYLLLSLTCFLYP